MDDERIAALLLQIAKALTKVEKQLDFVIGELQKVKKEYLKGGPGAAI